MEKHRFQSTALLGFKVTEIPTVPSDCNLYYKRDYKLCR